MKIFWSGSPLRFLPPSTATAATILVRLHVATTPTANFQMCCSMSYFFAEDLLPMIRTALLRFNGPDLQPHAENCPTRPSATNT